jgi:O-antigen/teichoic acid export membrane protein
MGEIQKQSIRGTVYIYGGAILGFITSALLFPKFLTTEEIGLINILIPYAMLFDQVFGFGITNIITRIFPYFRTIDNKHHGFLGLTGLITMLGFALSIVAFFFLQDILVESEVEKSELLQKYIHLLPIFIFATMFYNLFDQYNKVLFNASRGILLKEFVLRLFILVIIGLYAFEFISLSEFFYGYAIVQLAPLIILFVLLKRDRSIYFTIDWPAYHPSMRKEIVMVGLFGFLSSATATITLTIDRVMITKMLSLDLNGIYSTCFFFGTLVILPSRVLAKTISTYISEAWKNNDLKEIFKIYQSSTLNQFLLGCLLLIGIWANIDNIMIILGDEFRPGYWVILLIGLTYLSDMLLNPGVVVLMNSSSYRYSTYFILIMTFIMVGGNFLVIPIWSITGAAIATLGSRLVYNLLNYFYVWYKFGLQPMNYKHLIIFGSSLGVYFASTLLPPFEHYILDILIRSILITVAYGIINVAFSTSDEVNKLIKKYLKVSF